MSNALCAGSGGGGDGWKEIAVLMKRWDSRTEITVPRDSFVIFSKSLTNSLDFDELFVVFDASVTSSTSKGYRVLWHNSLGTQNFASLTFESASPVTNISKKRLKFERMSGYNNDIENYFYPPGDSGSDYLTKGALFKISSWHSYGEPVTIYIEAGSYVTFKIYGRNYNL